MTEGKKEGKGKTDGRLLRALRYISKTDWKSLALLISLFGGAGGSACNAAWTWLNDLQVGRTNAGTYDLLATRINELATRVEACEAQTAPDVEAPPVTVGSAGTRSGSVYGSGMGHGASAPTMAKRKKIPHKLATPTKGKPPETLPVVAASPIPDNLTKETAVEIAIEAAPAYKKARLPGYGEIQQAAQEADMDDFLASFK